MTACADHIHKFHFDVHAGRDIQYMVIDDGAYAMAAGDKAFPLQ